FNKRHSWDRILFACVPTSTPDLADVPVQDYAEQTINSNRNLALEVMFAVAFCANTMTNSPWLLGVRKPGWALGCSGLRLPIRCEKGSGSMIRHSLYGRTIVIRLNIIFIVSLLAISAVAREPLDKRIGRTDPSKYRVAKAVHAGAGELHYMGLFDSDSFNTNL